MTHIDLQDILRQRLPTINRWKSVTVYKWKSKSLPWYIYQPKEDMIYIVWTGPKRKNIHDYEYREAPLKDLKVLIDRNKMRLKNNTKTHR